MPPELETGPAGSPKEPDGAPATEEIEVTPAMIEAGSEIAERFYVGNGSYALTDQSFREAFCAMRRASPKFG